MIKYRKYNFFERCKWSIYYSIGRHFRISKKNAYCMRCNKDGLYHCQMHWTKYRPGSYIASLCNECFKKISRTERLYYYKKTFQEYERIGMAEIWGPWNLIEHSVWSGK